MDKKDLIKDPSFINTADELKDLLAGDNNILERPEFKNLDLKKIQLALDFITNNPSLNENQKMDLVENSWKINYRSKPPTPEEFLTEKYLGPTALHTYDRIKKVFCEFLDPRQACRDLILYPHIGFGKALYSQEKVMIPEGYRKIEDMKVGDIVITPDCGTAKVSAVQHFPNMPIYKITLGDGRVVLSGGPHYWKAARSYNNTYWDKEQKKYIPYPKTSPKRPCWKIITTEEILKDMESHPNQNRGWFIPLTKPVAHVERAHVISPYIIGALIGDGSIRKDVSIGNDDKEILDRILEESKEDWISAYSNCEDLKALKRSSVKYKIRFRRGGAFNEELARLGLADTYSYEKFIPEEYKYDSIENRIALLQGLMDTDGSAESHGDHSGTSYYTSSERLKDDFVELCSGLGAARCVVHLDRSPRGNNREYKCYRIDVTFPDNSFPVFSLARKQSLIDEEYSKDKLGYKKQRKPQVLHIKSIERTDLRGGTCIETDDEERLFLTNNYIVTHNSYLATLITLYLTTCITMMRDPYKYFGLNPATNLVQLLISYSLKKSSELLLEPYMQILGASPFFEKVRTKEGMVEAQASFKESEEISKIYYTTASPTSAIEFSGNLKIKLASSVQSLLGLSVVSAVLSELAFFTDAGKALGLNELVKTSSGPKKMKDVEVGDYVLSPSGEYTKVTSIPWQGEDDLYEIEVEDGRTVRCNRNHLWPVTFVDSQGTFHDEVVTTGFMIDHPDIQFELKSL